MKAAVMVEKNTVEVLMSFGAAVPEDRRDSDSCLSIVPGVFKRKTISF